MDGVVDYFKLYFFFWYKSRAKVQSQILPKK